MALLDNRSSRKLMEEMKACQEYEGDTLPRGYQSTLPVEIKVVVKINCLQQIKAHYESMFPKEKMQFSERFGKIAELLYVNPQEISMLTVLNFWDPSLRVFTFQDMDTTPTIEEYGLMLGMHMNNQSQVYVPRNTSLSFHKVASLIGGTRDQVEKAMVTRGKTPGWEVSYVLKSLNIFKMQRDRKAYSELLALVIYGLVLFPSAMGIIDQSAIDVFSSVLHNGVNPVPAILADTFLSLSHSRRSGKGNLRCCVHLLYVWICNHAFGKRYNIYGPIPKPIERFLKDPIERKSKQEWIDVFLSLKASSYTWCLAGMATGGILLYTKGFQCVPLIGTRGCVAYSPALVLRQYGRMQYIPRTRGLKEVGFEYQDSYSKELWAQICFAWEEIKVKDYREIGPFGRWTTPEYPQWFEERGKDIVLSRTIDTDRPHNVEGNSRDVVEEGIIRKKFESQLEKMLGEKRKKEEECDQLVKKIQKIEAENQKMCEGLIRTAQDKTEMLTSKIDQLTKTVDDQQGYIDMYRQKIIYLEEDAQRLRVEKGQALEGVAEKDKEITKRDNKIELLKVDANHVARRYGQIMRSAEENMTKLAARVKAIEDHATPLQLPEKELAELFEETKAFLKKWTRV